MNEKYPILSHVSGPQDVRAMDVQALNNLVMEIRAFIVQELSRRRSAHFSSNLGVVELTVALHHLLDLPADPLVWDVGHQCYPHKLLTGRMEGFSSLRDFGGLGGFPSRDESEYDVFGTGHAGTSISAVTGMALARNGTKNVAVIGDASLASGMALEALNHLGDCRANMLVVLNDNGMSIDKSVGALNKGQESYRKLVEAFGIEYIGIVDGHDLDALLSQLQAALGKDGPKVLHIRTVKGKGYASAEAGDPATWHAPGLFDISTGERSLPRPSVPKYQDIFGKTICELAENHQGLVCVTPAMVAGASLGEFKLRFPERLYDVGIAEQHAVTLSAGLVAGGKTVFCHIYSTFLQRGYDQLIHDVAIQGLPVVFFLDRSGFVGGDGVTHHGLYDIAYARTIPGLVLAAPMDAEELRGMMYGAAQGVSQPTLIRFPRGKILNPECSDKVPDVPMGKGRTICEGEDVAFLSYGTIGQDVEKAIELLKTKGLNPGHYDMRFSKPLDEELLLGVSDRYHTLITVEEGASSGGFGSAVQQFLSDKDLTVKIKTIGVPDRFFKHGNQTDLRKDAGIDPESIAQALLDWLQ